MNFKVCGPSIELADVVKQYWSIDCVHENEKHHVQRIVPNGLTELDFYFQSIPVSQDKTISISANTSVTGQIGKYYDIKVGGKLSIFSIVFQPQGLSQILRLPINEIWNQNIPLEFLLKDYNEIENKLFEAKSFENRVSIAESFLLKLRKVSDEHQLLRIKKCIQLINHTKGNLKVEKLANEACLSRKQFERVFTAYIGTTPGKFIKTLRFQNALYEKSINPDASLTDLAYYCGYYDQSHMTNDFMRLSGLVPKEYFKQCQPYSDYFQ